MPLRESNVTTDARGRDGCDVEPADRASRRPPRRDRPPSPVAVCRQSNSRLAPAHARAGAHPRRARSTAESATPAYRWPAGPVTSAAAIRSAPREGMPAAVRHGPDASMPRHGHRRQDVRSPNCPSRACASRPRCRRRRSGAPWSKQYIAFFCCGTTNRLILLKTSSPASRVFPDATGTAAEDPGNVDEECAGRLETADQALATSAWRMAGGARECAVHLVGQHGGRAEELVEPTWSIVRYLQTPPDEATLRRDHRQAGGPANRPRPPRQSVQEARTDRRRRRHGRSDRRDAARPQTAPAAAWWSPTTWRSSADQKNG